MPQFPLSDDAAVRDVQTRMALAGFYEGQVDGQWGAVSDQALARLIASAQAGVADTPPVPGSAPRLPDPPLSWGARVSREFRDRVRWIGRELDVDPNHLMDCMAWESAESFRPDIKNMAGSGATGLIQFMPKTAISLGTTVEDLAAMSAEDQLNFVFKYFRPFKGRLRTLGDVYMAILWPAGVGKPDNWTLWDRASRPTTYRQNMGLDVDRDGSITRGECLVKIREKSSRGRAAGNFWAGA